MRLGNVDVVIHKDKLVGSPVGGSVDGHVVGGMSGFGGMLATGVGVGGGGVTGAVFDLNDLAQELDQDEFDGINMMNGE